MRTLLSWLIANIELLFILVICIISARFLFVHWGDMTQVSAGGFILLRGLMLGYGTQEVCLLSAYTFVFHLP